MTTIIISTEPVPIELDGTTFLLQGDPSGGKAWATLMELDIAYSNAEERDALLAQLLDALASMAVDQENAETLRGLFADGARGVLTLRQVTEAYVEAVTTFPTKLSKPSNKR